jgi:hypothetical protein
VIDVDVVEIVEALQQVVRRIVEHVAAGMAADALEKHLEGHAVMQVFARMDLVADVDAAVLGMVEDRPPAFGQLVEGGLDETRRPLRPGIDIGPGQRAREARHRIDAHDCCEAVSAIFTCSTAHSCRAFGLPRTCGAAKPSKASS